MNCTSHYCPFLALLGYIFLIWTFCPIWEQLPQNPGWVFFLRKFTGNQWNKPQFSPLQLILAYIWYSPSNSSVATTLRFMFSSARSCSLHLLAGTVSESKPQCACTAPPESLRPRESALQRFRFLFPQKDISKCVVNTVLRDKLTKSVLTWKVNVIGFPHF